MTRGFTLLALITALSLTACPGVPAAPGSGTPTPTSQPGTPVPTELQGEWLYGRISSIQYYNPVTGSWGQPAGAGDRFKLEANSNYERSRMIQLSTYGCESFLFIWEKGTVKLDFDKSQISFQPADGAVKSQSCSASNSYEKKGPGSVKPETYDAEMGEDSNGKPLLRLKTLDGKGSALYGRVQ
jgi:hypothetical protein